MSRFLDAGAPTTCAHCGRPFGCVETRVEAFRGKDNRYYCDAVCAEEAHQVPAVRRLSLVASS